MLQHIDARRAALRLWASDGPAGAIRALTMRFDMLKHNLQADDENVGPEEQ